MSTSIRADFAELLAPLLPENWKIVTSEKDLGKQQHPVVRLSMTNIARHPSNLMGSRLVTFTVSVQVPEGDLEYRENELENDVIGLTWAIDELGSAFNWTSAEKGLTPEGNLFYDLTVTVSTARPDPIN